MIKSENEREGEEITPQSRMLAVLQMDQQKDARVLTGKV